MSELLISFPGHEDAEALAFLVSFLREDDELRTRVSMQEVAPASGEMGMVSDTISIALGPEGTGVALAGALTVWLRSRTSRLLVKVTGPNGSLEVEASAVSDPVAFMEQVRELSSEVK